MVRGFCFWLISVGLVLAFSGASGAQAQTSSIHQQRYTEIAFLAIIILLSVIAFLSIRTNRQRHRLNRELRSNNAELARLNHVKDKLFSVISHDLRGPLGNLQHLLTMIGSGELTHEQFTSMSSRLNQQIKASGNALDNLLHWAKSQLNETEAIKERVNLFDLADRVIRNFSSDLEGKSISSENSIDRGCDVFADRAQMEIVVRNLVGNAIKFSKPEGCIKFSTQRGIGTVSLSIKDCGVGMTKEQVESFHSGKHFTTPGTKMEKGTGIGLIIIREMINQNGGSIHAESVPGEGSTFTIVLPAMAN